MAAGLQPLQPNLLEMIHAAKQLSTTDRLLLAKTLLDSLVSAGNGVSINDAPTEEQNTDEDEALRRERAAFTALHPTLLAQYPGEYVAIHDGALVDHDTDGLALSLRVHQRFPDEFVWIAPLKAQPLEEWVVRSPRFAAITP
jgi:hypothetical protein